MGNTNLTEKLEVQFGLRYEDTKTAGLNLDLNQENINNNSKFFQVYISHIQKMILIISIFLTGKESIDPTLKT
ncbi:MAG: phage-related protein [Polaribacter sp.]